MGETLIEGEGITQAVNLAFRSLIEVLPRIMASLTVATILGLVSIVIYKIVKKLLAISGIDSLLASYFGGRKMPFRASSIINSILALGLLLVTIYASIVAGFPDYKTYAAEAVDVIARIASVFYMIILVYIAINYVSERLKMESGLGGYMTLIIFNIVLILLIDVTALSPVVKQALSWGLSLGLGLSVAVFTAWYFFGKESLAKERSEKS